MEKLTLTLDLLVTIMAEFACIVCTILCSNWDIYLHVSDTQLANTEDLQNMLLSMI